MKSKTLPHIKIIHRIKENDAEDIEGFFVAKIEFSTWKAFKNFMWTIKPWGLWYLSTLGVRISSWRLDECEWNLCCSLPRKWSEKVTDGKSTFHNSTCLWKKKLVRKNSFMYWGFFCFGRIRGVGIRIGRWNGSGFGRFFGNFFFWFLFFYNK